MDWKREEESKVKQNEMKWNGKKKIQERKIRKIGNNGEEKKRWEKKRNECFMKSIGKRNRNKMLYIRLYLVGLG